jgi:hypothetical protein
LSLAVALAFAGRSAQVRFKGSALRVFYKRDGEAQRLMPGVHVRTGDALRFAYDAPRDGYLMIVDVGGRGQVQALYPFGARESVAVHPGDNPLLPGGIALDGEPGPERLVAVYGCKPFTLAAVAGSLPLPGTSAVRPPCDCCTVETLELEKEP